MNTLKIYPKKIRENYEANILNAGIKESPEKYHHFVLIWTITLTIISSTIFYFSKITMWYSILVFFFLIFFFYFKTSLKASARIKKMEQSFPDVISLMASNLRSGITIDKAFLLSARKEFYPLNEEILKAGREITTGKEVTEAMLNMAKRIKSEKITKTVRLIISGIKTGGNMSDLLEQTSRNMKEKEFIEKRAASNILMYIIFIFFAVGVGAPILFALSSVLVEIIIKITSKIPNLGSVQMDLPFTFNQIAISSEFVIYFAVIFLVITDLISSLVIGQVNKGDSKSGLKYFIPLTIVSLAVFFIARIFLSGFLAGAFSLI